MRFHFKIILAVLVLLVVLPSIVWHVYQVRHPKPAPVLPREEITLTIIPGWNLRDVADYLVRQQIIDGEKQLYAVTGVPGKDVASAEGTLAPETVRFFKGVTAAEVVKTFQTIQTKQITSAMEMELKRRKLTLHELITMASIVEREARTSADRKLVAGIMWRRVAVGMPLQVDSSVHYAIDKIGNVFTSDKERATNSPWNTYKNRGLPPGPICLPSLESIMAALYPTKSDYWYFLSGTDGKMHYAATLDQHNVNRYKYIK